MFIQDEKTSRLDLSRGRVAVTIPNESGSYDTLLHIGHARSILVGSLICESIGIPFHLRIDGEMDTFHQDGSMAIVDISEMTSWMGIKVDKMYWHPQFRPSDLKIKKVVKNEDDFSDFTRILDSNPRLLEQRRFPIGSPYLGMVCDDIIDHPGTLIIRGAEYSIWGKYLDPVMSSTIKNHRIIEEYLHHLAGFRVNEIILPLIMYGSGKMSKSSASTIHWKVLQMASADDAKRYLIASVIDPIDPFSSLDMDFDISHLGDRPHVWSWESWARMVRGEF